MKHTGDALELGVGELSNLVDCSTEMVASGDACDRHRRYGHIWARIGASNDDAIGMTIGAFKKVCPPVAFDSRAIVCNDAVYIWDSTVLLRNLGQLSFRCEKNSRSKSDYLQRRRSHQD
jgi:hypothetical protein